MADKIEFTDEQQAHIDKLVGKARAEGRGKATADHEAQVAKDKETADAAALVTEKKWQELAEKTQARVKELEPLEAQAKAYEEMVEGMLKDKVKSLGETAKKAVKNLPKGMTAIERLNWLNKNVKLFQDKGDGVGTTKPTTGTSKPKSKSKSGRRPSEYRL